LPVLASLGTDANTEGSVALSSPVEAIRRDHRGHRSERITRIVVRLSDVDGGRKNGPNDARCVPEARQPAHQPTAVSDQADTRGSLAGREAAREIWWCAKLRGPCERPRHLDDPPRGTNPMANWNDPARWAALRDGTGCPICNRGEPLHIIATLTAAWVTMPEDAAMPGYACLVSRVHAVELHDLDEAQAAAFIADARRVARAVQEVTGAVKLNYEMHGNVLPHLHMHVFPRHPGDQFEGRAIDPRTVTQPVYAPGQFEGLRAALERAIHGSRPA
jgi:diadenosine tetraphosphate (Ap4A) HIT family hydrolase